jgi:hypothetical protein
VSGVARFVAGGVPQAGGDAPYTQRFVVWRHHPDTLRRPAANGDMPTTTQALTWNVFRTLELLPPAFWLRRLNASLGLIPSRPAPQTTNVRLWASLPVPPGVEAGRRGSVDVDVLIETESAVWALQVCDAEDMEPAEGDGCEPIATLAGAASWQARRRACFVGVIAAGAEAVPLASAAIARYQFSTSSLQLRLPARSHDVANIAGFGLVTWRQLTAILQDASGAAVIERTEQALASRALRWCYDVLHAR